MIPSHTEHDEQVALFQCFSAHYKKYPELMSAFAIPNGGHRILRVAQKLKAEGMKAGVPDIFIPAVRGTSHGLFVELKRIRGGVVSDAQKDMMWRLSQCGYACLLAKGWQEAWKEIEDYLKGNTVELGWYTEKCAE